MMTADDRNEASDASRRQITEGHRATEKGRGRPIEVTKPVAKKKKPVSSRAREKRTI